MATKVRRWLAQQQDVSVVQLAAYMRTIDLYANFRFIHWTVNKVTQEHLNMRQELNAFREGVA